MPRSETLDKSKGLAFTYDGVNFYHGLYSKESYCGQIEGILIYLSSPECLVLGREKVAKLRIGKARAYLDLR